MKLKVEFIRIAFEPAGLAGSVEYDTDAFCHPSLLQPKRETDTALNKAFAAFNRGSESEIKFEGPSASVGDIFLLTVDDDVRCKQPYLIMPIGFKRIDGPYGFTTLDLGPGSEPDFGYFSREFPDPEESK